MDESQSEQLVKGIEKTPIGTVKEGVIAIPEAYIHPDSNFPSISIRGLTDGQGANSPELAYAFAKQFVDSRVEDNLVTSTSEITKFLGRASTSEPGIKLTTADGKRSIVSIKTKPTGMADFVKRNWDDYRGKDEAFFQHVPTNPHGDKQTDLVKREAFLGLGSHIKERQRKDAENSLLLHQIGVKTRLPITGWDVDAFMVWDEEKKELVSKNVDWFKAQGFTDDELYQAAWGLSCPITLEDVNDYLLELANPDEEPDIENLNAFLSSLYELAKADISSEYQELSEELRSVIEENKEFDRNEVADILKKFGIALARTAGRNYHAMYSNSTGKKYTHGVLHDQNISFFGEWCDNFTVKEGLLEIGLAPENSADISGLKLALNRFSRMILLIKGEKRDLDLITKASDLAERVFYKNIRDNWPSYEEFCQENHEAELNRILQEEEGLMLQEFDLYQEEDNSVNRRYWAEKKIPWVEMPFGENDVRNQ